MGDGMYISSPDAYDGETCRLTIRNRLEDFYHNETLCEYENCKGTAVHHCADGTLYWEGCGRVFMIWQSVLMILCISICDL